MATKSSSILTRNLKRKVLGDKQPDWLEVSVSRGEEDPNSVSLAQLVRLREGEEDEEKRRAELFERWLHSPERTKKWRRRLMRLEEADEAQMEGPLTDVWIQCEEPGCMKWRRISAAQFETLDKSAPWFCHLNPDPAFRQCIVPQEDATYEEKLAHKLGVKYIISSLPEGSLVLAKMTGFKGWPGVVSRDPRNGEHVCEDSDGEPLSYHVEYLGQLHTHSWVSARQVEIFRLQSMQEPGSVAVPASQRGKKGKRKRSSMCKGSKSSFRKDGVLCTLTGAMTEAEGLVRMDAEMRLKKVIFRYKEEDDAGCLSHADDPKVSALKEAQSPQSTSALREALNSICAVRETQSSPPSVGQDRLNCQLNTSMLNCSKQEKFSTDVQMYCRNQKAFDHDVRRFMIRNQQPILRLPCWQDTQVSLFQLFLAVYERGGFDKVTANKQWIAVYREVTGLNHISSGSAAKIYYKRHLFPYELFIAKKDYQHCFEEVKSGKAKKIKSKFQSKAKIKEKASASPPYGSADGKKANISPPYCSADGKKTSVGPPYSSADGKTAAVGPPYSSADGKKASSTDGTCPQGTAECDLAEIDGMLSQLQSYSEQCFLSNTESTHQDHTHATAGMSVTFYDESPRLQHDFYEADTALEFGPADIPGESIQEVPDLEHSCWDCYHRSQEPGEYLLPARDVVYP